MSSHSSADSKLFYSGMLCGAVATALAVLAIQHASPRSARKSIRDSPGDQGASASDGDSFISAGRGMLEWIVNYRSTTVHTAPVISTVAPNYLTKLLPATAPASAESWDSIFHDIDRAIVPGLTHWESNSKFFAYFKPHASYPAVLGELLCAGLNVMGFDWIASPAATELEVIVLDWLAEFLNLPQKFLNMRSGPGGSVIQGSAGEAAIVAFLAAIVRKQGQVKELMQQSGDWEGSKCSRDDMVVFASDQAHAIVQKACMVLGIGHCRIIETSDEYGHFALNPADLEDAIKEEVQRGRIPIVVVGTTGTTSSCCFDPIAELAAVATRYNCWMHVDAAYGGAYAALPELSSLFKGLDAVDSFVVNCHKKLLCPFDLSAMFVADRRPVLSALSLQPEYLRNAASDSGAVVDYEHWQLPLGRRFRALKLWFVMRRYGKAGLTEHLRNGLVLSDHFAYLLSTSSLFELVVPVSLSLVCFRLANSTEEEQKELLDAIKATGDCFIVHTKLNGRITLRFACGGIEQSKEDVRKGFDVILREAEKIKSSTRS